MQGSNKVMIYSDNFEQILYFHSKAEKYCCLCFHMGVRKPCAVEWSFQHYLI
jgi:hypothetical protein